MEKTITTRFLDEIRALARKPVPEEAAAEAGQCLADYMACAVLGADLTKGAFEAEAGDVPLIGRHSKSSMHAAALINGMSAHMAELDDGQRFAMLHPGAPVISALISAAAHYKIDGSSFIKGIVIGYETTIRLGAAIQPGHKLKGFHATGSCGAMGAALGLAAALDLKDEEWDAVFAAAASDAAGLLQLIDDGSELKPYNIGRAAAAGINALIAGRSGLKGPGDVLGGKRGFFTATAAEINEDRLLNGFMPQYAIKTIYRKPYAACRHTHAAIEAVLKLREQYSFIPDDTEEILIRTYGLAIKGHEHTEIKGAGSAKMSMPYSVAAALKYGRVNYQQYEEDCLSDEELACLMKRVRIEEDPELSALVPAKRGAIVSIRSGKDTYTCRVDYPRGEPENPVTAQEIKDKFFSLCEAAGWDGADSKELYEAVMDVENRLPRLLELI
ncbi:MAG: MmgE/PrpD family protein [Lachnospiraceae bacterium]|nr:MmgE/PrpD family protein [Lachnospiraceae bacterium]